jgi:predicted transcriptional regulator YheO
MASLKKKSPSITLKDKQILESFKPTVDAIAAFWGENCEVLLHSLESLDCSIIHIANGHITGRQLGSPITDLGMKILKEFTGAGESLPKCYYSKTTDGKTLRSITVLIKNEVQKPIGMLCINFNMNASLMDLLRSFDAFGPRDSREDNPENFVTNPEDLIQAALRETISSINQHQQIPNHNKNKTIVHELAKKGIFDIRGAIDIVARELSVSRYTIYNYIRENKFSAKKEKE